jgi:hypothetical protein
LQSAEILAARELQRARRPRSAGCQRIFEISVRSVYSEAKFLRKQAMNTEMEFLKQTSDRFKEGFERIMKAIRQLDTHQIWTRPSSESNSIGIILQHLNGNLNQYVCAGVGGADYHRNRPEEFKDNQPVSKEEILEKVSGLAGAVETVISRVPPDSLHQSRQIQNLDLTVMSALYKAATHFEFHEGQILYISKLLLNERYAEIWGPKKTP